MESINTRDLFPVFGKLAKLSPVSFSILSYPARERDSLILQRVKNVATAVSERERRRKCGVYCVVSHGNMGEKA